MIAERFLVRQIQGARLGPFPNGRSEVARFTSVGRSRPFANSPG
jgi:hypothetical protein